MSILITGGLGDFFSLESIMTEDEKSDIDTIYWATNAAKYLIEACHNSRYKDIKHIAYPINGPVYSREGLDKAFGLPDATADWGVLERFPQALERPYSRSAFLDDLVPTSRKFALPRRYIALQAATTLHANLAQRMMRDLDRHEWNLILARLKRENIQAVVLNTADAPRPPIDDSIIDLTGKTSISESIAIVAKARGYWGIASCLSVLACQIFEEDALWIKGPESWFHYNRHIYCAPYLRFPFVYKHLADKVPCSTLDKGMKTVMFNCMRIVRNTLVGAGSLVDLEDKEADGFINTGQAVLYKPKGKKRTASVNPVQRKATKIKGAE